MIVDALTCSFCNTTIYSRARHDFRFCDCQSLGIDGGRDYTKITWTNDHDVPAIFELDLGNKITQFDLHKDWNYKHDIYGKLNNETNCN